MNPEDKKMRRNADEKLKEAPQQDVPVCNYAPEWAEHARFNREDEPCDDGRMGIRPCAEDEAGCPVTGADPSQKQRNT